MKNTTKIRKINFVSLLILLGMLSYGCLSEKSYNDMDKTNTSMTRSIENNDTQFAPDNLIELENEITDLMNQKYGLDKLDYSQLAVDFHCPPFLDCVTIYPWKIHTKERIEELVWLKFGYKIDGFFSIDYQTKQDVLVTISKALELIEFFKGWDFSNYRCQIIGINCNGKKYYLLNFFDLPIKNIEEGIVIYRDGGESFFQIGLDAETMKITRIAF